MMMAQNQYSMVMNHGQCHAPCNQPLWDKMIAKDLLKASEEGDLNKATSNWKGNDKLRERSADCEVMNKELSK
jgi:hypothetical protein